LTGGVHRGSTAADKSGRIEKGAQMRTGKRHLTHITVLVLASLALVPAAQASGSSPDDRALPRAATGTVTSSKVGPDDRAYARDSSNSSAARIVSPDDRALVRRNWAPSQARIVSPDDRAVPRAVAQPGVLQVTSLIEAHGFDWGDAMIGGAFGLALAMLGLGGIALIMRRRTILRTA
jgi:hypothetical protein